jgi:hypothetical protein
MSRADTEAALGLNGANFRRHWSVDYFGPWLDVRTPMRVDPWRLLRSALHAFPAPCLDTPSEFSQRVRPRLYGPPVNTQELYTPVFIEYMAFSSTSFLKYYWSMHTQVPYSLDQGAAGPAQSRPCEDQSHV